MARVRPAADSAQEGAQQFRALVALGFGQQAGVCHVLGGRDGADGIEELDREVRRRGDDTTDLGGRLGDCERLVPNPGGNDIRTMPVLAALLPARIRHRSPKRKH
jgi:hypothetical protein